MKVLLTSDTHYGMDGKTHSKHAKFWRTVQKEIAKHDIRVMVWAGDIAVHRQRQLHRSIEQMREYISIPVVMVRGNHDWWDALDKRDKTAGQRGYYFLEHQHKKLFQRYGLHHLEWGPKVIDDVIFCGWDGWYGLSNPPTNDETYMFRDVEGVQMHTFMSNRAWRKFDEVLEIDTEPYRAAVAVTHHNPYVVDRKWEDMCANLKFYDMIKEKFDFFCCGHNHQRKDRVEDGCRVLNSGSDYNNPQYLVFEV